MAVVLAAKGSRISGSRAMALNGTLVFQSSLEKTHVVLSVGRRTTSMDRRETVDCRALSYKRTAIFSGTCFRSAMAHRHRIANRNSSSSPSSGSSGCRHRHARFRLLGNIAIDMFANNVRNLERPAPGSSATSYFTASILILRGTVIGHLVALNIEVGASAGVSRRGLPVGSVLVLLLFGRGRAPSRQCGSEISDDLPSKNTGFQRTRMG